jgi:hypothetical protein
MKDRVIPACAAVLLGLIPTMAAAQAQAEAPKPYGRIAFYSNTSRFDVNGVADPTVIGELITQLTYRAPDVDTDGFDFGVDLRHSGYVTAGRDARLSIYDGFVGARMAGGTMRVRAGYMWINDLGALGSVAGGLFEVRQTLNPSGGGRFRAGVFGGFEPKFYDIGVVNSVRKMGGYVAYDGTRARRHVLGYVRVRNSSLTERSVVSTTNYLPIGSKVFVYQAAEYDLTGPGGQGSGGLTYFFASGRVSPVERVELQGTFNRGRSIDSRAIIDDQLNGRPIATGALEGLRYESTGGRVYVEVVRGVRVHAGYARDRTNREDVPSGRLDVGVFASNLARTGFDVTVSDSRMNRSTGRYDSWYVSVGHSVGRTVYLSGDYTSSLSVVNFTGADGEILIDTRPRTTRISGSGIVNVGRSTALLFTVERTADQGRSDLRLLAGASYRLR